METVQLVDKFCTKKLLEAVKEHADRSGCHRKRTDENSWSEIILIDIFTEKISIPHVAQRTNLFPS